MATSKKPTGISISRNKLVFSVSWKRGESYSKKQSLQYRLKQKNKTDVSWAYSAWKSVTVSKTATSKDIELDQTKFYPSTQELPQVSEIEVRIKGQKKKKKVSAWSYKSYTIEVPKVPTISFELDSTSENKGTFTWSTETSDTEAYHTYNATYQSALMLNYSGLDKDAAFETIGTAEYSDSWTKTEDVSELSGKSYRRITRVCAQGIAGDSTYAYEAHTYGFSNAPKMTDASCTKMATGEFYVRAAWNVNQDNINPIDTMSVEYAVATPTKDSSGNLIPPDSASWTSERTLAWQNESCGIDFHENITLEDDQCIFVRVGATHDKDTVYSDVILVYSGSMPEPTVGTPSFSGTTVSVDVTNNSEVTGSFVAIEYNNGSDNEWYCIHKATTTGTQTFDVPSADDAQLRAYAVYSATTDTTKMADDTTVYVLQPQMKSDYVYMTGENATSPPKNVKATVTSEGNVLLSWDNAWEDANELTVSWSTRENAWESTKEPESYDIDHICNSWNISELDDSGTYYFRIKARNTSEDPEKSTGWSETVSVSIAEVPVAPVIATDSNYVGIDGSVVCSVGYSGNDALVRVAEVFEDNTYFVFGDALSLSVADINDLYTAAGETDKLWITGSAHTLKAMVTSSDGTQSAWSDGIIINVVASPTLDLTVNTTDVTIDTRTAKSITAFPITAVISSVADTNKVLMTIKRDEDYELSRPDEKDEKHYEGEVIYSGIMYGSGTFTITLDELLRQMDDGARYRVDATVTDVYGQTLTKQSIFEAHFSHQPEVPTATIEALDEAFKITVNKPSGYEDGDTFDLYRLTSDLPELIIKDGIYDTEYADPYPAYGSNGYRVVNKTANGDYITSDDMLAWTDYDTELKVNGTVIEFDGERVWLTSNIDLSNSWSKDFTRTSYLGGAVQGDWNPAVTRDLSVSAVSLPLANVDDISNMRDLAEYPGICHIRTQDGSSFWADIQVKEDRSHDTRFQITFTLDIKRVDAESLDGMLYSEYIEEFIGELEDMTVGEMQDGNVLVEDLQLMTVADVEE